MEIGVSTAPAAPAFLGSGGRGAPWLHEDGTTPVTTGNPARLGETVTARMTGMGPVYESGNTTVGFEWSAVESYFAGRGGAAYAKTAVHVIRRRATTGAGVYLVTIRLPDALHGGTYRYEGIETMLAGGREASLSRLPLRLPA